MSGFASVNFSETDSGLFTPDEIRHLMRVEHERAVRYAYPITMMLIEIDRLEALQDLYGLDSKEEILQAVITLLRSITRSSDFLGSLRNDRLIAVFPHTPRPVVTSLAGRLLSGCRDLDFRSGHRTLRITLSIGVTTPREGDPDFARFERLADEALLFAITSGGDRFVESASASDVIDALRLELDNEEERLASVGQVGAPAAETVLPEVDDRRGAGLRDRIRELFRALGGASPELQRLEKRVVEAAEQGLALARDVAVGKDLEAHERQIGSLESRVGKLRELLDEAEDELRRVAVTKGGDPGVASIYRSVQGLAGDETDFRRKKEMLTLMFEANIELQRKFTGDP